MKCPLIAVAIVRELGEPLGDEADCLKEECAWWVQDSGMCALTTLAIVSQWTSKHTENISKKLRGEA